MSLKKRQMFKKTVISAKYVILASMVFYEKIVFADKYIILAASRVTPSEGKVFI